MVRHRRQQRRPHRHSKRRFLTDRSTAHARAGAVSWLVASGAVASALVLAATAAGESPYLDGAPPGFSGGFGEDSCLACHFDEDLNEVPGRLTLSGVPASYAPGETYPLTISLSRPGFELAGFQLTARFEDGAQAGVLAPPNGGENRVTISSDSETRVLYAHQRGAAAEPAAAGAARWTVSWKAPEADATRAVLFHVAANAADGDGSASGDYVYTTAAAALPR